MFVEIRDLDWGMQAKEESDRLPSFTEVFVILQFFQKKWAKNAATS